MAKKLDLARWWEEINTSWSLLTFEYFCSSSFSSRCKLQILANNSGCPSFILQMLTSLQGICVHFALLWPDEWQTAHTFPCETFGKSSKAFCLPWMWFLALSTCNSSSLRFSESSQALRSNGLWKVSELWFEGVAIASNPKLVAAWDDCCCGVVSTYRSTPLSHAVIFSHFGSRWLGRRAVSVLMFFSSASNKRLSASNSLSGDGNNESKSSDFT